MHTVGTGTRLAIARLWYEGNSFNPVITRLPRFHDREWVRGEEAVSFHAGTATEIGGALEFLDRHRDWRPTFLRCASASPGGPVRQEDLDAICDEIVDGIASAPFDAVYLSLHGAALGTGEPCPERRLLQRVREVVGPAVPVAASFDMHACLDPVIGELVDIVTGYHTYPHVDMAQTARRALQLLDRCLRGEIDPRVTLQPVPMLPPSHRMGTDHGPMAELVSLATAAAREDGIHDATVFGGFAYADSPHAHVTVSLCHERRCDPAPVRDRLARAALDRHRDFLVTLPTAAAGLAEARRRIEAGASRPVALLEPADNPLSGGLADATGLLRAVLDGADALATVFAYFHDPDLVDKAHRLGEGMPILAHFGGRLAREFGEPVVLAGKVLRLTDGRMTNVGPMEHGVDVRLGRTAVIGRDTLQVVVAETSHGVYDPAWCTLHGIDLASTELFCVKAKNHFRAAFAPLCDAIIEVDTPGPAPLDLSRLDYRFVPPHYLAPREPR